MLLRYSPFDCKSSKLLHNNSRKWVTIYCDWKVPAFLVILSNMIFFVLIEDDVDLYFFWWFLVIFVKNSYFYFCELRCLYFWLRNIYFFVWDHLIFCILFWVLVQTLTLLIVSYIIKYTNLEKRIYLVWWTLRKI